MPDKNLTRITAKNFRSFVAKLPGSAMWRHLYVVDEKGVEYDATNDGDKSCAYMVSSVLTIFQLIDKPHATIKTTLEEMSKAGWQKVSEPVAGAIVEWKDHIGFYLADDFVVSNSSSLREVARQGLELDGQKPIGFYVHPELKV